MSDLDALAFYDALPPDERAALDAALREHPALAEAFARWQSLRASVRAELARDLPDRALLVLYALADDDLLTDAERAQVDAARPALDAALDAHPGLVAAVRRIRADRDAFDAAWADALAPDGVRPTAEGSRVGTSSLAASPLPVGEGQGEGERGPRPVRRLASADRPALRAARPTRWIARVAAVAAVVAFAGVLTFLAMRDAGWETVAGAQTVTLADGSTIQLADGARLQLSDDDPRQARMLGGRALFRIAHDPAHPFEVTTPNAEVMVLGTTFTVDATDVETEVTLVQGAVTLMPRATPDAAVRLAPGERSRVLALDAPTTPEPADLGTLAWTGSVFARDLTLGEVARQLAERFDTPVAVAPALDGERVSDGEYGADGLRDALDKLALALGAHVEAEGGGFRIVE
ncbi:FecR family protein [Rubrivirga sp.]|uniref:FecR family protein n=1 Tax=Rubrivirga sp. TaxID=1885344 RepID=UPI003B516A3E